MILVIKIIIALSLIIGFTYLIDSIEKKIKIHFKKFIKKELEK